MIINFAGLSFVLFVLGYAACGFIAADFDFKAWVLPMRIVLVVYQVIAFIFAASITLEDVD